MSKPTNIPFANLKRYGSHLEKIIEQARQTSHLQRAATISFNLTQNISLIGHLKNTQKHNEPIRNTKLQSIKQPSKLSENNSHRKSASSFHKELKASTKKHRSSQVRCRSDFVQSPNHKSLSIDKKSIEWLSMYDSKKKVRIPFF